ncbi:hypothetical protein EYE40_12425 [Glaciihabitans arcticus]|uniref:Uncharacterized protein n=1 Tax=Glaciihabitans arcticus TaxID=2668039 RepID=A0A4Q9GTS9_9MICO|nr:hypothetical protein [Glaciihabitans arcticus]TBN58131.1 hypothetical protein EYE40_12425 [Glaciihabitans arcticus]
MLFDHCCITSAGVTAVLMGIAWAVIWIIGIFFVGFMFSWASKVFLQWADARVSAGVRRVRSRRIR